MSVLPAMQLAQTNHYGLPRVPGTGRTSYFYRREAIAWRRQIADFEWIKGSRELYKRLALSYLALWKKSKSAS